MLLNVNLSKNKIHGRIIILLKLSKFVINI